MTKAKTNPSPKPAPAQQIEGEGNYTAARHYNRDTAAFAKSGQVEPAARDAAEARDSQERAALDAAERAGKERAKDEDPALKPGRIPPARDHA